MGLNNNLQSNYHFWLRLRGEDLWHLRRRYKSGAPSGVCGYQPTQKQKNKARPRGVNDCWERLGYSRKGGWDWDYVKHFRNLHKTQHFCTKCMSLAPDSFSLALVEAREDE